MSDFNQFDINEKILQALEEKGYSIPTPIQQQAITPILNGNDILGCAQTGTGKTAAFAIPILNNLEKTKNIQALILTPTRELAIQIKENFDEYSSHLKIKSAVIYGGIKQGSQVRALQQGPDILIATPGRLLDLINQKYINLKHLKFFVLDEADNMLDMGFIHDINKLLKIIPKQRQTLMFSATMPDDIKKLASKILNKPIEISVTPVSSTIELVEQFVYFVDKENKSNLLFDVLADKKYAPTLIFTRTKHGADKLVKILKREKFKVAAIHGNKSQNFRERVLDEFKQGKINTLIATDIAARGLDISDLAYVINYDIPNISETYVHRIGRTGRAGQNGVSISLCCFEEKPWLKDIQKLINKDIEVVANHNYPLLINKKESTDKKTVEKKKRPQRSVNKLNKPEKTNKKVEEKTKNTKKPNNKQNKPEKTNNSRRKKNSIKTKNNFKNKR